MIKSNIVLVGFMGSGKSALAKMLGSELGRPVASTDRLIEALEKRTIAEIFKLKGEGYFRMLEQNVVEEICQRQGQVIDCGGGVVLQQKNIDVLKEHGTLFYLKASAEFLYEKLKGSKDRPLLNVADPLAEIRKLLKVRESLYSQSDHVVRSENRTIPQMCQEILAIIKKN